MTDTRSIRSDPQAEPGKKKIPQEVSWVTSAIAEKFDREYHLLILTRELAFYAIFLFCVTFAAVVKIDPMTYFMTYAVKGQLTRTTFTSDANQEMRFGEIRTIGQFYSYAHEIVSRKIFKDTYSDLETAASSDQSKDRGILFYNRLISEPVIRQVTAKNTTCHPRFRNDLTRCYSAYSGWTQSKTKLEGGAGSAYKYSPKHNPSSGGYDAGTRAVTYYGEAAIYRAGGFFRKLGKSYKDFRNRLTRLKMEGWLKEETRAVFLDMQFYNPHVDLFSVVKLVFEMPPTGQLIPTASVTTFQCDKDYTNKIARIAEGCMIVYCLYILYYLAEEVRQLFFFQWSYFRMFWTKVNWCIISASIVHFVCYCLEKWQCFVYYAEFQGSTNNYWPLQEVALFEAVGTNAQGVALFFIYLKLLKYACLNRCLGRLHHTLRCCYRGIHDLLVLFVIVMLAFAMAGFILFGTQVLQFSSVGASLMTLFRTFVGDFYYAEVDRYHWHWGPVFFTAFIVALFFIFVHLFLAVLSATYTEVKTDMGIVPHRIQLCAFWGRGCANCLRDCGCAVCVPRPLAKKHYSATVEEIRTILSSCGFSKLDIDMFLARYNIDPHEEIRRRDVSKLIETIRVPTSEISSRRPPRAPLVPLSERPSERTRPPPPKKTPIMALDDFASQQERLDRLENIMAVIAEKLEKLLKMMNTLDQKRGRQSAMARGGRGKK